MLALVHVAIAVCLQAGIPTTVVDGISGKPVAHPEAYLVERTDFYDGRTPLWIAEHAGTKGAKRYHAMHPVSPEVGPSPIDWAIQRGSELPFDTNGELMLPGPPESFANSRWLILVRVGDRFAIHCWNGSEELQGLAFRVFPRRSLRVNVVEATGAPAARIVVRMTMHGYDCGGLLDAYPTDESGSVTIPDLDWWIAEFSAGDPRFGDAAVVATYLGMPRDDAVPCTNVARFSDPAIRNVAAPAVTLVVPACGRVAGRLEGFGPRTARMELWVRAYRPGDLESGYGGLRVLAKSDCTFELPYVEVGSLLQFCWRKNFGDDFTFDGDPLIPGPSRSDEPLSLVLQK